MLWALQKYQYWILRILYSDHNPVTLLTEACLKVYWSLAQQNFYIESCYRCGKFNDAADRLSGMVQLKDYGNQPGSE